MWKSGRPNLVQSIYLAVNQQVAIDQPSRPHVENVGGRLSL
jgi:hypothetical protein